MRIDKVEGDEITLPNVRGSNREGNGVRWFDGKAIAGRFHWAEIPNKRIDEYNRTYSKNKRRIVQKSRRRNRK